MNARSLRHLLSQLEASRQTGALHVDGTPGGVLFLEAGQLTHAESPACPGVGQRLVACGRLSVATWTAAYEQGKAQHRVGRTLVRDGHLAEHELAARVVAVICDTTHALLQGEDAAVRFVPGERHWLGAITRVELGALIEHTAKRLRGLPAPGPERELPRAGRLRPGRLKRKSPPENAVLSGFRCGMKQVI